MKNLKYVIFAFIINFTVINMAGVVIFLIPSLLSLVVDFIDARSLYDKDTGKVANYTRCMLNPINSFASIGGEWI